MRYYELFEGRDAPLYHATGFRTALQIIAQDVLQGSDGPLSLTRDRRFAHFWAPVVFVLDQARIAQGFPLQTYRSGWRRHEAEERIPLRRPLAPLTRYLTGIEVASDKIEKVRHTAEYRPLLDHPLLRIVPPVVSDEKWVH